MTMTDSRLNVAFSDRQNEALESLAHELGMTKAGVLKTALALLETALRERKAGNQIAITRDGVVVKEIVGLWEGDGDGEVFSGRQGARDRELLSLVAYKIRDQAHKLVATNLQSDHDEFYRLVGLVNLPPDKLFDALARDSKAGR
jgi:biotin operon repressor